MLCRFSCLLGAVALLAVALPATGWPGFDWDAWQALTEASPPEIESPQAGLPDLMPLLKNAPEDPRSFPALALWRKKQAQISSVLSQMLGMADGLQREFEPAEVLGEEVTEAYRRQHLRIPGEQGDPIPAYLLLPKRPVARPTPAMIVLHQTQAAGKDEAAGLAGDPEMAFADELAKRGYICIVPDAIGFGERIPEGGQPYDGAMDFYEKHPAWSFFGKMAWDTARVVDYLAGRGDVDAERIGVIGHSHGAYGAIMAAAREPRIAVTVASCGFTTLRADPNPERWSHKTALMPRLGFYLDDITQAPFDWHEVAALIAPRAYFNWATLDDSIFPNTDSLQGVYEELEGLYALYGLEDNFRGVLAPGKHAFPKEAREQAYAWVDRQFRVARDGAADGE